MFQILEVSLIDRGKKGQNRTELLLSGSLELLCEILSQYIDLNTIVIAV